MPGAQLSRRHFSIRPKRGTTKSKPENKTNCSNCLYDFVNLKLIPIKITFFLIMGATQCTAPYATLLKKQLGLTVEETALIYTIGPLIAVVAPFLAGIITNRAGNFRIFLIVSVVINGMIGLSVILIPVARTFVAQNETKVLFNFTCDGDTFKMKYEIDKRCTLLNRTEMIKSLLIDNCGYLCSPPAVTVDEEFRKRGRIKSIPTNYNSSLSFDCEINNNSINEQKCFITKLNSSMYHSTRFSLHNVTIDVPTVDLLTERSRILSSRLKDFRMNHIETMNFNCKSGFRSRSVPLLQMHLHKDKAEKKMVNCHFHCTGIIPLNKTCNTDSLVIKYNIGLSVGLFIVIQILSGLMTGLTFSLFEAGVLAVMEQFNYDYGLQRIYGSIGGMVFAPLTGLLIDYFGKGIYSDYYIASYIFFAVKIICALILIKLDLNYKKPTKRIFGNICDVFSSDESMVLILVVCISGMCYGFIEHFLPWHMDDLGADNWMIGLMTTVASFSALPFLVLSGPICRKLGHIQCICFGLVCYSVRCFGYSMIQNPLFCYPFEVLESITTGLLIAAAIFYGASLSSSSNLGTLQGMLAIAHYGIGKSIGSLVGGYIMAGLSTVIAFRMFSGLAFLTAVGYYLFYKLVLFPRRERRIQEIREMPVEVISANDMISDFKDLQQHCDIVDSTPCTSTPMKY